MSSRSSGARVYTLSAAGCLAIAASPLLPWLRLGDVGLRGLPDPAGFFVLAVGAAGLLLSAIGAFTRRDTRQWLVLASLAALTTLVVVWRSGPVTIADRAQAHAEAVAIVDNVAVEAVPPVTVGAGLYVGIAGALVAAAAGLTGVRRPD